MKLNKIVSMLAVLAFANAATAEQDGFKISGDFATSIFMEDGKGGNAAAPTSGAIPHLAPGGATGAQNADGSLSLDMVELNIEKAVGNSAFVAGLGFGRIFDQINSVVSDDGVVRSGLNLTNAYFSHRFGDTGLSLKLGRMQSFIGHETYNYMDNMNYTRGYAFNYMQPYYLTGLNVNYMINEMIDIGVYVVNSNGNFDLDENRTKSLGAAINIRPMEGMTVRLNYLSNIAGGQNVNGPAAGLVQAAETDVTLINAIVGYNWNQWDFNVQYLGRTEDPRAGGAGADSSVIGVYAGYKADVWGAGLRYEMADYDTGSRIAALGVTGNDNTVNAITASAWYDIDQNARLKLDIAQHSSDDQIFVDDNGAAEDSLMVYGLGFAYRF